MQRWHAHSPEHDALVTSAELLNSLSINRLCNVWALLLNSNHYIAGPVVHALCCVIVADLLEGVADDLQQCLL
jgi:hypothetical protein